jgi:hypothetical protein
MAGIGWIKAGAPVLVALALTPPAKTAGYYENDVTGADFRAGQRVEVNNGAAGGVEGDILGSHEARLRRLLIDRLSAAWRADYDEAAQVKRYDGAHAPEMMPPTLTE